MTILWIHSSPKLYEDSMSSRIGYQVACKVSELAATSSHSQPLIEERDVYSIPHLDQATITKFHTPDYQDTLSYELIQEVKGADYMVICTPMHNFGISSGLKAWIDHIVISRQTFAYEKGKVQGLLKNIKKAFVVVTSGGNYAEESEYDNITKYLNVILRFIGIHNIQFLWVGNTSQIRPEELIAKTDKVIATISL